MSTLSKILGPLCCCTLFAVAIVYGQVETANPQKPTASDPLSANPATLDPEAEARQAILNSREWRKAEYAFYEWLSVQKVYTPAEVERLKRDLSGRIQRMSAAELQSFLAQIEADVRIRIGVNVQWRDDTQELLTMQSPPGR